jgi:uncharacterized protein YceK
MRTLILITVLLLSGCSTVDKVKEMWPRAHDPVMVSTYIDLEKQLEDVSCKSKESFDPAMLKADWLNRYAEFRNDPQRISTKAILENLEKAKKAPELVCDRWVVLSKTRMKIIKESWSGR